jgi:glycerol-3-phosphate dehydrogenase
MQKTAAADIVIFGGGIAGLWILHRLRQLGLTAILLETHALGGGQSNKAQGIIHGGMKFALNGILSKEAKAISDMPGRFQKCLAGTGEINLSAVPVLSDKQYLWTPYKFTSKLASLIASATLSSEVKPLSRSEYPSAFQNAAFKGEVFTLEEIVLDVPNLLKEIVKQNQDAIFKIESPTPDDLHFNDHDQLQAVTINLAGNSLKLTAQQFIFAAGAGNELITKRLKVKKLAMQRRPLHMVMLKTPFSHPLYAHCLGLSTRPRVTITTHTLQQNQTVWYISGLLAEEGVRKDQQQQIQAAKEEIHDLFPWLDFNGAEYAAFTIDRPEPLQKGKTKPETVYAKAFENSIIAWPSKLALTPKLADEVEALIRQAQVKPELNDLRELRAWPIPPFACPVWEEIFSKNVA